MKVFIADISDFSQECLQKAASFLSATEKERLKSMISVKRQKEFIAGHFLLRQVLSKISGQSIEEIQINTLASGALMPADKKLGFVSLSHSFDKVAIAVSPCPVGVDIEKIRDKDNYNAILEQIDAVKAAQELLRQGTSLKEAFFRLWTRREACYKLCSIDSTAATNKSNFYYQKQGDFMICVASSQAGEIIFEKC